MAKDKTGVPLKGITAINPVNNKEIPIWISDYVLISYGTVRLWQSQPMMNGLGICKKNLVCRS